eukprot:1027806-Rhodomonas_salina.1
MGVQLNEGADVEANKGLYANECRPLQRPVARRLLAPVDNLDQAITDLNGKVRMETSRCCLDNLSSVGGLNTESFLAEGRGQ